VTASGKSVDGLVAALSGSGTAALRDIAIAGIAPDVFPDLIARADAAGAEIDAAAVSAFAPPLVRAGTFEAAGVDIAFTLANGALRAPPFRLEAQGAALAGEVGADFTRRSVAVEAALVFDPAQEALAGAEPTVRFTASGPLDALRVDVDTGPLAQFLTQRALELEQQRVEAMQAALVEKQRLRREARYYAALAAEREAAQRAAEEAERLERDRLEREERERLRREEEAERRRLDDEARRAQEEARRQAAEKAAEEAAARSEAERRRDEDARLRAEVEALLRARAQEDAAPPPTPQSLEIMPTPAPRDMSVGEPLPAIGGGATISDFLRAIGADR
jgi:hypothetical protein